MTSTSDETDRIERQVNIDAPRAKVWQALTDAEEFGDWFGCNLKGQKFVPGQRTRGPITFKGYEHVMFDVDVERMDPQDVFAYRWHPYAVEKGVDYSGEQRTLVTFTLKDTPNGGTLLKVVESGFDKVPPGRRMEAFRMNSRGWEGQVENIVRHVTGKSRLDGAPHQTAA